ncbi:MAG: hypothetical protein OXH52_10040 [Gammaproteobacteria bacterium]|nr:hypothetical protein [Gammaproteobacteria bacterium]
MTAENSDVPSLTVTELGAANYIASQVFHHGSGTVLKHDLASYLLVARAVYQAAMSAAKESTDAEDRAGYQKVAYMTAYNIAANCWPGWSEEGAAVTNEQRKLGAGFARAHLEIVSRLDVSVEANAYWINAAHELAAGDHEAAKRMFSTCADHAASEGARDVEEMAGGWVAVVEVLQGIEGAEDELEASTRRLVEMGGDGPFYAEQYGPALAVFGS